MSDGLRRFGFIAFVAALALWAHLDLLASGPAPEDLRWLAGLRATELPASAARELPEVVAPLARGVLGVVSALAPADDAAAWRGLRVVQLLALLGVAWAAGAAARAALVPWLGADGAAWAGRATALLVPVHPLVGANVVRIEALGNLLACGFGALACALFLRARHERSGTRLALAFLALIPAALGGRAAAVAVVWLALVELTSSQRHRPLARSLRTALTTFVAAAAIVAATWLTCGVPGVRGVAAPAGAADVSVLQLAYFALEKMGVLLLPGSPEGVAGARLVALGVLLLVVAHPALVAARSAPRLWGLVACGVAFALAVALGVHPRVRVAPGTFSPAQVLLPATLALALALAVASTALAGTRRWLLPLLLALAWAFTARLHAQGGAPRADELARLRAAAVSAVRELGPARELWFVQDEHAEELAGALASARPALLFGGLARADEDARAHAARTHVRGADVRAVTCALRATEFDELRAAGLVLVVPAALLAEGASPARTDAAASSSADGVERERAQAGAELVAIRVAERGGAPAVRSWRGDRRSPELDSEPAEIRAVRVTAQSGAPTGAAPRLAWQAREPRVESGSALGAWLEGSAAAQGSAAPQAWFDLEHDLRWLLGRRIARVSCEGELAQLATAELLAEPARVELELRAVNGVWSGTLPEVATPRPLRGEARWTLVFVELGALASTRCELEFAAGSAPGAAFTAPASRAFTERARARGARALDVSLEYAVGSVTLLRSHARAEL